MEIIQKDLANILGITTKTIQTLTDSDVFTKDSNNKYDLNSNVQAYIKYKEQLLTKKSDDHKRLIKLKADSLELELAQVKNELIPVQDAQAAWSKVIMTIKNRLLAIPKKTAPLLANKTAAECEEKIKKNIYEVLKELAEIDLAELSEIINDKKRNRKRKHSGK